MKSLFYNNILIVLFTFAFLWAVSLIPFKFDALDPISKAFSDFDLTDIVFSRLRPDRKITEQDIVLVNMSVPPMVDRMEIAQMLDTINKHKPAVVAIDAFYRKLRPLPEKETQNVTDTTVSNVIDTTASVGKIDTTILKEELERMRSSTRKSDSKEIEKPKNVKNEPVLENIPALNPVDSALMRSFNETKNLILVTGLRKYNAKKSQYDSLETSHPLFCKNAKLAFASLTTTGQGNMTEFLTTRTFIPQAKVLGKNEVAFAVKIAELYAPEKAKRFLERNNTSEFINFQGNIGFQDSETPYYPTIDYDMLLQGNFTPDMIKGKIVILGFMGKKLSEKSFDDKFYTPLNKNYVGKSTPDMFGVIVHANIVSMILKQEYIDELPDWLNITIMVFAAFLSISLFSYFFRNLGYWYDAVTVIFQFLISFMLFTATVFAFLWFRIKIDTSLAIGAVVFSGLIVEIYYGLIYKLLNKFLVRKRND